jgi:hypothetical protein
MHTRRSAIAVILAVATLLFVALLASGGDVLSASAPSTQESESTGGEADEGFESEEEGKGGEAEAEEEARETQERIEAWKAAKAAGNLRVTQTAAAAPTAGWAGETVMSATADDWEPAIAADPNSPFVYLMTTRYTGPTACGNRCPLPYMMLRVSSDGGVTWGPDRYICTCTGVGGQFDPEIEVVPGTGAVYAAFMNGYNINFSKSTDHGQTWSTPVPVYGKVSWTDKPVLAVSDNGQDVYVAFNGPQGGDPFVAQSHNAGATWTQTKVVDSTRYYFAFDGDVLPNGTVVFSESSLLYGGGGKLVGQNFTHVFRSTNAGATWTVTQVDTVENGPACTAAGCSPDYYPGHTSISADANGALVLLYDGATTSGGNETVWARRSTDGGVTWSARQALSTAGEMGDFPVVESRGSGDVRAWYMQTNGGNFDAWNVWYRSSTNGGSTWSAPVLISDSTGGAPYKTAAGFGEPYGDYGEAAITNGGKFIGIWGEEPSYTGPGGVWVNRQL